MSEGCGCISQPLGNSFRVCQEGHFRKESVLLKSHSYTFTPPPPTSCGELRVHQKSTAGRHGHVSAVRRRRGGEGFWWGTQGGLSWPRCEGAGSADPAQAGCGLGTRQRPCPLEQGGILRVSEGAAYVWSSSYICKISCEQFFTFFLLPWALSWLSDKGAWCGACTICSRAWRIPWVSRVSKQCGSVFPFRKFLISHPLRFGRTVGDALGEAF